MHDKIFIGIIIVLIMALGAVVYFTVGQIKNDAQRVSAAAEDSTMGDANVLPDIENATEPLPVLEEVTTQLSGEERVTEIRGDHQNQKLILESDLTISTPVTLQNVWLDLAGHHLTVNGRGSLQGAQIHISGGGESSKEEINCLLSNQNDCGDLTGVASLAVLSDEFSLRDSIIEGGAGVGLLIAEATDAQIQNLQIFDNRWQGIIAWHANNLSAAGLKIVGSGCQDTLTGEFRQYCARDQVEFAAVDIIGAGGKLIWSDNVIAGNVNLVSLDEVELEILNNKILGAGLITIEGQTIGGAFSQNRGEYAKIGLEIGDARGLIVEKNVFSDLSCGKSALALHNWAEVINDNIIGGVALNGTCKHFE